MKKICLYCGKEFETHTKSKYCCHNHFIFGKNKEKFPDNTDYVKCKICGYRANDLHWHTRKYHSMSIKEYCSKYNISEIELTSQQCRKHNSEMQKLAYKEGRLQGWGYGDKNPSHSNEFKSGRNSAWSMNFKGYDGLSDDEKRQRIKELSNKVVDKMNSNSNNSLRIDYYTSRGYSLDEAKQMLKDRQATFTLEKCIEKYGKEKGQEIFEARQKKWQDTLNAKPQEERERILKAKMCNGRGYSKISQELFIQLEKHIHDEYDEIFYATNGNNINNEYVVFNCYTNTSYLLDFYVKDNNKVIEFDGDYWHGERRGNQLRDKQRENDLKALGYVNILHVKERDYRNNPQAVIDECLQFIRK